MATTPSIPPMSSTMSPDPGASRPGQAGLLISSGLVGFLLGAAVHGVVADRFGRRGTLLGGLWITSIFTLLTALFANSFLDLLRAAAVDGARPRRAAAAGDHLHQRTRAAPGRQHFALWGVALGWAARRHAGRACRCVRDADIGLAKPLLDRIAVLPAAALHASDAAGVAEIPGDRRAASRRSGKCSRKLRPERARVSTRRPTIAADDNGRRRETRSLELLQPRYRRTTLAIWAAAFLSLFCIFGLSGWIPTVMIAARRDIRGQFWIWRADADHVVRRRASCLATLSTGLAIAAACLACGGGSADARF